ncbi:TPA: beta strand repeat-containing protein, partial [Salmonella enterica subsp. enterica serovar Reading]
METSSRGTLLAAGDVQAGKGGEWLLDPADIEIVTTGENTGIYETGKGAAVGSEEPDHTFSPTADSSKVSASKINEQLKAGTSVVVKTSGTRTQDNGSQGGNITVNADITKDSGGDATLTLEADKNITVNKNITSSQGKLNVNLIGAGSSDGAVVINAAISANGGDVNVHRADKGDVSHNMTIEVRSGKTVTAGNISLVGVNNVTNTVPVNVSGNLTATNTINISGQGSLDKGVYLSSSNLTAASVVVTASSTAWEAMLLSGGTITATNNIELNAVGNKKDGLKIQSNTVLNSTNGNITLNGRSESGYGVVLNNVNMTAGNESHINGQTNWQYPSWLDYRSAIDIKGNSNQFSGDFVITGNGASTTGTGGGVSIESGTVLNNTGNLSIIGNVDKGVGVTFQGGEGTERYTHTGTGNLTISGNAKSAGMGISYFGLGYSNYFFKNAENAGKFVLKGDAITMSGIRIWGELDGVELVGRGSTGVEFYSPSSGPSAPKLLNHTSVTGEGTSNGISFGRTATKGVEIDDSSISGISTGSGAGIRGWVNVTGTNANISGSSVSGPGVVISGDNTISGGHIAGTSVSGSGVDVIGTLSTTGKTDIVGKTTTGNGVNVSGTLNSTDNGLTVSGDSDGTGHGVYLTGTVNGTSVTGDSSRSAGVLLGTGAVVESGAQILAKTRSLIEEAIACDAGATIPESLKNAVKVGESTTKQLAAALQDLVGANPDFLANLVKGNPELLKLIKGEKGDTGLTGPQG